MNIIDSISEDQKVNQILQQATVLQKEGKFNEAVKSYKKQ